MKKYIFTLAFICVLSFGFVGVDNVNAQKNTIGNDKNLGATNTIGNDKNLGATNTIGNDKNLGATNDVTVDKLKDPLGESTTLEGMLLRLFDIIFYIGIPVVAFFLIYSGFMFVVAQGRPGEIESAKRRLGWTIVGAILLLGAWTISQAIKGTIDDIKKGAVTTTQTNNKK